MRPALCLSAVFVFLAGCDDFDIGGWDRYREDFHFSYPLGPAGRVQLDNFNGSVEISGWEKDAVDIDGTKYARSQGRLKEIQIDVTHSASSISIRTLRTFDGFGSGGARYVLHVPKRAELAGIATSNGAIRVDTIDGNVRLRTSGSVHASRMTGSADIRTSNGRIELAMDAASEVHAHTSNGSITVRLPVSAGASVRARTSNGSITSDFGVNVHAGILSRRRLEGTIGNGGPVLDLSTSNGSIRLRRP